MKTGRFFLMLFLMVFFLYLSPAAAAQEGELLRLHVLADSDSAEAQEMKLQVRDAVLACAQSLTTDCTDADAAWEALLGGLPALQDTAQNRAKELGFPGDVTAEMGLYAFPDRTYGKRTVPAGDYRAVRIVLGEGKGSNWWCVIYPDFCLTPESETSKPVYSALWRWLLRIFSEEAQS